MDDDIICVYCAFYVPLRGCERDGIGECRRFPPKPIYNIAEKGIDNRFPLIKENDFCGEWEDKTTERTIQ